MTKICVDNLQKTKTTSNSSTGKFDDTSIKQEKENKQTE
jgi:hypothetical protein